MRKQPRIIERRAFGASGKACFIWLAAALAGCSAPAPTGPPVDAEYARDANTARTAFDQGLMEQSAMLYEKALRRAETMDQPGTISDAAYNLAASLMRSGKAADLPRARSLLREAESASQRSGNDTIGILLLDAKILRMLGDRTAASAEARHVVAQAAAGSRLRVWGQVLLGDLAADAGDVSAARESLTLAQREAVQPSMPLRAALSGLDGRVALLSKDFRRAAVSFDAQADLLQQQTLYHEMALARLSAGKAYHAGGLSAEAVDRLYRASRSLASNQDLKAAEEASKLALDNAEAVKSSTMIELIKSLIEEISIAKTRG